jgi:hypothetical protein
MMDEELKPEQLSVKDGDIFEVIITDGKIRFIGKSRK